MKRLSSAKGGRAVPFLFKQLIPPCVVWLNFRALRSECAGPQRFVSCHRNTNRTNRTAPQHNPRPILSNQIRESGDGTARGINPTRRRHERANVMIPEQKAMAAKITNAFGRSIAAARGHRISAVPLDIASAGQKRGTYTSSPGCFGVMAPNSLGPLHI